MVGLFRAGRVYIQDKLRSTSVSARGIASVKVRLRKMSGLLFGLV